MSQDTNKTSSHQNFDWIRGESGTSYLCPKGSVSKDASENELKSACVDESDNPQNN